LQKENNMKRRFVPLLSVSCALSLALGTVIRADELLTNGNFATGTLEGWNVDNQAGGSGTFVVISGTVTPIGGQVTVGPPPDSKFYAVSDQTGPGAHALSQLFTVPAGATSAILSFDMFVNDWSGFGPLVNPAGLDYTAVPNQHSRVDLLSGDAPPFDTGAGVLANFYLSVDPGANPHAYSHYEFDITDLIAAGGTFRLRFGEVDNQFFLNQGVGNVSIDFTGPKSPVKTKAKQYR
jgi:hypothetical protein